MWSDLIHRVRAVLRRNKVEKEIEQEFQFHLQHQIEKHLKAGMTVQEASMRARVEFGGLDQVKEHYRDTLGTRWLEDFLRDCRQWSAAAAPYAAVYVGGDTFTGPGHRSKQRHLQPDRSRYVSYVTCERAGTPGGGWNRWAFASVVRRAEGESHQLHGVFWPQHSAIGESRDRYRR
jgi:hypothetical protein